MPTRANETSVRDALVAFTSQRSPGATSPTVFGRGEACLSRSCEWPFIAVVVLSLLGFGFALAAENGSASCHPLNYAFIGAPPEAARVEFQRAAEEIHLRTGLHFEEVGTHAAELLVAWLPGGLTADVPPESGFDLRTETPVGSAAALWEGSSGARRLESGRIDVDGSRGWQRGLGRDALGAVFTHELGHVLGLDHNADPASYMYPRVRASQNWTAEDLTELARLGGLSGCVPPLTSA